MPNGDGRSKLAIVGLTLAVWLCGVVGLAQAQVVDVTPRSDPGEDAAAQGEEAEDPTTPDAAEDEFPYAADYERLCDEPRNNEEADLCQQWRSARAAERMVDLSRTQIRWTQAEFGALLLTVGLSAWATIAASRAVGAANHANEITIGNQRPWLSMGIPQLTSLRVIPDNSKPGSYGLWIEGQVPFTNAGKTPALKILFLFSIGERWSKEHQREIADIEAALLSDKGTGFIILAPGQTHIHYFNQVVDFTVPQDQGPTGLGLNAFFAAGYSMLNRDDRNLTSALYNVSQDQEVRGATMMGLQVTPSHLHPNSSHDMMLDVSKVELRAWGGDMT